MTRSCNTDLKSYGQEYLFSPINAEVGDWSTDADNYNMGALEIYVTARDMAKFGMLYLRDGEYDGNQVLSADWEKESLQTYSEDIKVDELDMLIVTTADPLYGSDFAGEGGWKYEGAINNLVGKFIKSLPRE